MDIADAELIWPGSSITHEDNDAAQCGRMDSDDVPIGVAASAANGHHVLVDKRRGRGPIRSGGVSKPEKSVGPAERDWEMEYALEVGRSEGWTSDHSPAVEAEILRLESARRTELKDRGDSD